MYPTDSAPTSGFDLELVFSLHTCLAIMRPLADHGHWAQCLTLTYLRPASWLQTCLATRTLGWSWLPSLDLLCLPCLGTAGLGPCGWGHCHCLPCCLLLAHLLLQSNALARALPDKHHFWSPWSSDHTVNTTGRKARGVGEGYPGALVTSPKYSRKNSRSHLPQKSILRCSHWQMLAVHFTHLLKI